MGFKHRLSVFLLIISGFITSANAQILGGSEVFGGGSLGEIFLSTLDAITFGELDTLPQAALFLAVVGLFYFVEKNIFEKIFIELEELIIGNMSGSSRIRSDEFPTGAKGMALSVAFISANGFTGILGYGIGSLLGITAILAILFIFLRFFNASAGNPVGKTSSGISSLISSAAESTQEAERQDSQGDEAAATASLQDAIEALGNAEKKIDNMEKGDIKELRDAVKNLETAYEADRDEYQSEENIEEMKQKVNQDLSNIDNPDQALSEIEKFNQAILDMTEHVNKDQQEEQQDVKQAVQEVNDAAKDIKNSVIAIKKMKKALNAEETEMKHLVQEAKQAGHISDEFQNRLGGEEEEIRELENRFQEIEGLEQEALDLLGKAIDLLEKEEKISQAEIEDLKDIYHEEEQIKDYLTNLQGQKQVGRGSNFNDRLTEQNKAIDEIAGRIRQLENKDENDYNLEDKERQKVSQIYESIQSA